MTLVACFKGTDGIVMASDSRGTIGDPRGLTAINDTQRKLFRLSDYVGIVGFGQAELAAQMIVEIQGQLQPSHIHFSDTFAKTREVLISKYEEWFRPIPFEKRELIGFIMAGLEKDGAVKMYYLVSRFNFAPQLCTTGIALGGIPQYATYLVHRLYNPEMTTKHLIPLAVYVISETATQDTKVGGPIRVAEITIQNRYKELDDSIINEVVRQNEKQNERLREFFFKREG